MSTPSTPSLHPAQPLLRTSSILIYLGLAPLAILLPFVAWLAHPAFISSTSGPSQMPFELLGLTFTAVLAVVLLAELRQCRSRLNPTDALPLLLLVFVCCRLLVYTTDFTSKTDDYRGPELAAQEIVAGRDPYLAAQAWTRDRSVQIAYTWPPLTAQILAATFTLADSAGAGRIDPYLIWNGVFYVYQAMFPVLVFFTFLLLHQLASVAGLDRWPASALVAAVMLFNVPLVRLIRFNQINLWILVLVLLALATVDRRPWIAGLALALGVHIKLYPVLFLIPLVLTRRYRAAAWMSAAVAAIAALQSASGLGSDVWPRYLEVVGAIPCGGLYRDSSFQNLVCQTGLLAGSIDPAVPESSAPAKLVARVIAIAAFAAFALRAVRREHLHRLELAKLDPATRVSSSLLNLGDHFSDISVLMLLVSPMVWEHHYVLALPVVVWAAARSGVRHPWRVILGAAMILVVPVFDVFILSHHRLLGLLLLTSALPVPAIVRQPPLVRDGSMRSDAGAQPMLGGAPGSAAAATRP